MSVYIGKDLEAKNLLHITSNEYSANDLLSGPKVSSILHSGLQSLIVTDSIQLTATRYGTASPDILYVITIPDDIVTKMSLYLYNITFEYHYHLSSQAALYGTTDANVYTTVPMIQKVCTFGNQSGVLKKAAVSYSGGVYYAFNNTLITNASQYNDTGYSSTPKKYLTARGSWNVYNSECVSGISLENFAVGYVDTPSLIVTIDILNINSSTGYEFPDTEGTISLSKNGILFGTYDITSSKLCVPTTSISIVPEILALGTMYANLPTALSALGYVIPDSVEVLRNLPNVATNNTNRLLGQGSNRTLIFGGNGNCAEFINLATGTRGYYNVMVTRHTAGYEQIDLYDRGIANSTATAALSVVEILNTSSGTTASVGLDLHNNLVYKNTTQGITYLANPAINTTSMLVTYPDIVSVAVPTYTSEGPSYWVDGNAYWDVDVLLSSIPVAIGAFDNYTTVSIAVVVLDTQSNVVSSRVISTSTSTAVINLFETALVSVGAGIKFTASSIEVYRTVKGGWYYLLQDSPVTVPFNMSGYTVKLLII